ncbi:MAG: PfkB family carbohydrate kinase, partial [Actinomycetota bacterium]|nr:PfkB family carbohydrate kinase [Actinomycetota bacterium]
MSGDLAALIERFSTLRVVVVGDAMLDTYFVGESRRLSQEAPVPVVAVSSRRDLPGGAANTAANARALGADVSLVALVGDDPEGALLNRVLAGLGVGGEGLLVEHGRRTLTKHRVLSGGHMLLRFDQGDTAAPASDAALVSRLVELADGADAILVSDYAYGVVTPALVAALADLQAAAPRVLVVDSKDLLRFRPVAPTAVKPNWTQALELLSASEREGDRGRRIAEHGDRLLEATGAAIAAVTLDAEGALVLERGRP